MVNQPNSSNKNEIRALLGDEIVDSWNEEKVTQWLEQKGWGHFASTFKKHHICQDRFFQITLAELVQYLPRTMTTYYERRRLLNEIRSLIPSIPGQQQKPTPSTPSNISINTNLYEFRKLEECVNDNHSQKRERSKSPHSASSSGNILLPPNSNSSDNTDYPTIRDSGIGHSSYYSTGSSSSSPSSEYLTTAVAPPLFSRKHNNNPNSSPTRSSYSPKATFLKIKNTIRSYTSPQQSSPIINTQHSLHQQQQQQHVSSQQNSACPLHSPAINPRYNMRHESGDEGYGNDNNKSSSSTSSSPIIPARVSSTPDKILKFWAHYSSWHSSSSQPSSQLAASTAVISSNTVVNSSINNTHSGKRSAYTSSFINHSDHYCQQYKKKEQRIQVTADEETWYSLIVTDVRDPVAIKIHILNRLNFTGNYKHYMFFHENGAHPDTPLEPQDLMYLCSIADHSASQRILVKSMANIMLAQNYLHYFQPSSFFSGQHSNKPELGVSPTSSLPSMQSHSRSARAFLCRKLGKRSDNDTLDKIIGIQLSDPPQSGIYPSRQRTGSEPHITSPPLQMCWRHSEPNIETIMSKNTNNNKNTQQPVTVGLWAIPPQSPSSSSSSPTQPPTSPPPTLPNSSKKQQLWAVIPNNTLTKGSHSLLLQTAKSTIPSLPSPPPSSSSPLLSLPPNTPSEIKNTASLKIKKTEFWGERPPAEVVFQHIEHYFDSQALDKEVVVPISTIEEEEEEEEEREARKQPRRRLTHTKSVRLVAREASQKYSMRTTNQHGPPTAHNNSMNEKRTSPLQRKSTKLWGQHVVELKTKNENTMSRVSLLLPEPDDDNNKKKNKSSAIQWVRGKLIGKGSFGRVYLAFNVATGEMIAVKQVEILKPESKLLNDRQQPSLVEAFYQEIMMLRDLDHENIVQYLGYGQDGNVINIFLEYVSGGSIASRLALQGAFDEPLTKHFTRQICAGLEYLHSKHILHRDIKAANILVEVDGTCKISDFGLSKKNDYDEVYDQNSRMSLRGTIYWMAPEVVKNEPYSAKVDIWSLGCTVIEMLTGQRPWISLNQIAALYNLGRLNTPTIPENISDCARDFLKQCFIIDPLKRPTATELLIHNFLKVDESFNFKDYVDKGKV